MTRRILAPVFVSWALVLSSAHPSHADVTLDREWQVLRSPNFQLIGDAGERTLRSVARQLEQFRETIGAIVPGTVARATPVTVIVFRSHKSFQPFKPLYQGKPRDNVSGYFQPGRADHYIALTTEGGSDFHIVYHEYLHMAVNSTLSGIPVWLNEGLAEYYGTFSMVGRDAMLGRLIDYHVLRLRGEFLPLETLAAVDHASPLYNEENKTNVFYAQSWALVHYLMLGKAQQYQPRLRHFVQALITGVPFERACTEGLGVTPDVLEKELRSYVRQQVFHSVRLRFDEKIERVEGLRAEPLPAADAHASLGTLLARMGREEEARPHLEKALALNPDSGLANAAMGSVLLTAGDHQKARQHLERAIQSPDASFLTHYTYAWVLQEIGKRAGGGGEADRTRIVASLRKAIALNPDFAPAYAQLAWHRGQETGGSDETVQLMRQAIKLEPGREDYILSYAYILVNRQEYRDTGILAGHLATRAKDPEVRQSARELLGHVRRYQQEAGQLAAVPAGRDAAETSAWQRGIRSFRFAFRPLEPGESRVFGRLKGFDCSGGVVTVTVEVDGALLKPTAPAFDRIDFVTFRDDLQGQVACGPRDNDPVMLVYRPDADKADAGTVVAVEFVPLDYRPH